jgi:phosphopantetheinyl transferase (holo-ACP synthase)
MRPQPLQAPVRRVVGNDLVDLDDPRCHAKHLHGRFLARVFAPEERDAIASAADPERAVWVRWAAKEAAYKVISKVLGAPPPFTHASFVVHTSADSGTVSYGGLVIPFQVASGKNPLHVIALDSATEVWPRPTSGSRSARGIALSTGVARVSGLPRAGKEGIEDSIRGRFSERERPAVHSLPSALARLGARAQLARMLDVEERRLEIVCELGNAGRSPPVALLDSQPVNADVSLSHHGRWVGWSVLVWEPTAQRA